MQDEDFTEDTGRPSKTKQKEVMHELRDLGAELVELSLLSAAPWPDLDGLYLGGGFPETQAEGLAAQGQGRGGAGDGGGKGQALIAAPGGADGEDLERRERRFELGLHNLIWDLSVTIARPF